MIKKIKNWQASCVLLIFVFFFCVTFLHYIGIDALEERNDIQFFADSWTYHKLASSSNDWLAQDVSVISVGGNFLGPLLILNLLNQNYYLVLIFNFIVFSWGVIKISQELKLDSLKLLLIILINPTTISSLISINKEIISFLFVAYTVSFYHRRSFLGFMFSLFLAILTRWQLAIFAILVFCFHSPLNPLKNKRRTFIFLTLLAISLAYYMANEILAPVIESFEFSADQHDGSGIWNKLIELQGTGLYILAFPLKAAQLLFGLSFNIFGIYDHQVFYNDVVQTLASAASLGLLLLIFLKKNPTLESNATLASIIYLAIFSLSPIFTPRYLYPVYIYWAIFYCQKQYNKNTKKSYN
ncbi:hypothetical protein C8E02_1671 [Vogesella indigofera]|uniref:Dolichyl-phosphate-mannose-protein mannosyltransferase n=1 Tax=Vogesella indigofera TaxID=45465 RepID=A0A495BDU8_VOGIN|nr:hypothetical protein [Vogesella indigofera]RKQ58703.1 hypothetical protein C8E02_1671 [Vogesella indigofera]